MLTMNMTQDEINLIKLTSEVVHTYNRLRQENIDPKNPNLPRMRVIGGRILRLPHAMMFRELSDASYDRALGFGYDGTYERWCALLRELVD